ncbi:MAG TPA: glycogen-binding domain-containing protein, partial [Spirochaetota bacterium]|nr:glycogen-binding domain-containing protein [Spirochaetota bacterium]
FIYEDENARSVHLVGDFNSWRSNEIVLERAGDSKLWSAEITLEEGLYKYGFLVNETYIVSDPLSGLKVQDSFGNESSLMVLADGKQRGGSS